LELNGGGWLASRPGCLIPGNVPRPVFTEWEIVWPQRQSISCVAQEDLWLSEIKHIFLGLVQAQGWSLHQLRYPRCLTITFLSYYDQSVIVTSVRKLFQRGSLNVSTRNNYTPLRLRQCDCIPLFHIYRLSIKFIPTLLISVTHICNILNATSTLASC
jgi:hypothetical protein